MIITRTPLRISLIGGGSDLPEFFEQHPGHVISFTIDKYIYIAINEHFGGKIRISYSQTENVDTVGQIDHELIRHALLRYGINAGVELVSMADVPGIGTGLGSSSAYLVGALLGLSKLKGEKKPGNLAEIAYQIERKELEKPVGKQDHYAAHRGGFMNYEFHSGGNVAITNVSYDDAFMRRHSLLFWTGIARQSSAILTEQQKNTETEETFEIIKEMVDLIGWLQEDIMNKNPAGVGFTLDQAWHLKKQMASNITTELIDNWYEKAQAAGAWGGKICGAGGGGFLFLWVPEVKRQDVIDAMENAGLRHVPFSIVKKGAEIIYEG